MKHFLDRKSMNACILAASALMFSVLSHAAAPSPSPSASNASSAAKIEAERLASRAEALLTQWDGQRTLLIEANKLIEEALSKDPASAHAMVEKGRLLIMAGNTFGNRIDAEPGMAAAEMFEKAAKANPGYARAYTLQGHVYTLMGRMAQAKQALEIADRIGTDDPWQLLNWSDYWYQNGDTYKSVQFCEKALKIGTQNTKALTKGWQCVGKFFSVVFPDRERSDNAYKEELKLNPQSAWTRGNRAQALAVYFQDFEAAEQLARETIAISNYPHVRGTLSLALYGKWARAIVEKKDAALIQARLLDARAVDPDGSMLPGCAIGRPEFAFLVKELEKQAAAEKQQLNLRSC